MFFVNDQYYTIDDLEAQYRAFENIPQIRGCKNRRIAVCMSDVVQWLALCLYIRAKGGSVFPIHPSTPKEGAIRLATAASSHLLIVESIDSIIELSNHDDEGEGCLIQMSSGTTGNPKCIERTWKSVEEEIESYTSVLPVDEQTRSVVACPVTHSYGLISGVLACFKRGAEPVIITNMNPKYILKKLGENQTHILYGAPALLHTLSRLIGKNQRLDMVMTSGMVMPSNWLTSLKQVSRRVLQQYGCSEAGCVAIHPDLQETREMGYPLPHVTVEAGDGNTPGEIMIHTSSKVIYTQDLGYMHEGVLFFLARMDDTINVAGLNVYPQEVENVLMDEPRVVEAVVYKKQNKLSGERVCVQFVSEEPIDEMELREWCSKFLAPHQIPVEFKRVLEIAKLPNGKVSRKQLEEVQV